MSALFSLYFGSTSYPNSSNTLLVKTAVFKLDATTLGAKNNPCKIDLLMPRLGPTSLPSPGSVSLSPAKSTSFFLPAIYAPLGAIPPPKFLFKYLTFIFLKNYIGFLSCS